MARYTKTVFNRALPHIPPSVAAAEPSATGSFNQSNSIIDKGEILSKLYREMEDVAADYKHQFDAAFARYVDTEPGADAILFARLKMLAEKTTGVVLPRGFSATAAAVDGERHESLEAAVESFATESGAKYDAVAPNTGQTSSNSESDTKPAERQSRSLVFQSIGGLTKGVDILITNLGHRRRRGW